MAIKHPGVNLNVDHDESLHKYKITSILTLTCPAYTVHTFVFQLPSFSQFVLFTGHASLVPRPLAKSFVSSLGTRLRSYKHLTCCGLSLTFSVDWS